MQTADYQRDNGGGNSLHPLWKEFIFGEEFSIESTSSSIDKNKLYEGEGNFPYITRTDNENGIDHFVPEQNYSTDEGNVITIGLDTQTVFYQPTTFYTGQNIQVVRHPQMDKYNALFIRVALQRVLSRFSWGSYGATLTRLRKSRIYLPATKDGQPDFAFMSSFMHQVEQDILRTTMPILQRRLDTAKSMGGVKINELRLRNFYLRDVFPTMEAGKSKGLNHLKRKNDGISYLGATNLNNGVLDFVEPISEMIQKGNCIAFIRNGEGSMGYSIYKEEDFIATSDITLGYNEHLNKYNAMFITTIADRIRGKYNFGYKRSAQRLAKEILTLPATEEGDPDWQFMESYMRNLESIQIAQYLSAKC